MQVSARLPAVGKGAGGPPPPPPALFPRPSPPGRRSRPGFGGQNFPERPSFAAPRRPAARSSQQRGGPRGGAAAPGSGALRSAGDRAVLGPSGRPRVRWGAGSSPARGREQSWGGGLSARGCLRRASGAGRPGRAPGRRQVGEGLLALRLQPGRSRLRVPRGGRPGRGPGVRRDRCEPLGASCSLSRAWSAQLDSCARDLRPASADWSEDCIWMILTPTSRVSLVPALLPKPQSK